MNQEFKEVAWLLMLIPFGIVSGTGLFFIFYAWRKACQPKPPDNFSSLTASGNFNLQSSIFEQPTRWLAVKTTDLALVQGALKLVHPMPCSWEEGLMEAREDKLFISAPISGWIIVVGSGLPGPFEDVDVCFHFLTNLSRKVGEVQFFCASRVVSQHAWVLMERGRVYRAYAWAGQTLWNQGPMTAAEKELHLRCFDYCTEQNAFQMRDELAANSEKIAQLAGRWGLDPGSLCTGSRNGHGIVGALAQPNQH